MFNRFKQLCFGIHAPYPSRLTGKFEYDVMKGLACNLKISALRDDGKMIEIGGAQTKQDAQMFLVGYKKCCQDHEIEFSDLTGEVVETSDDRLDEIHDAVDYLMEKGLLEELNSLLKGISVGLTPTDELLGFLTATLPVKDDLFYRPCFYIEVSRALMARGQLSEGILQGLY